MLRDFDKFSLPEIEEKVLKFWKANHVFSRSLSQNSKKKKFVFYEGPPTANGRPGIHHVLARSFKDIILRYKTMRGFYVPRKGGWDTHGLPVELEVEKSLGISSKKEIEKFGISEFNRRCRESVWKYKDEWERLTERMGFWIDLNDPYITYENEYMESVWNIFSHIWKKKLLYKGYKVVPWCPRCGTGLSSHELSLGYKEVEDASVYVKFKVKRGQKLGSFTARDNTYVLSWTTTPWTLPGNTALAVGKNIKYEIVRDKSSREYWIAAKSLSHVFGDGTEHVADLKGKDLVGVLYNPLFKIPFFQTKESLKTAYRIYDADFVTTEDGTGVVHTAVMYGEDDYNLGKELGLPEKHTVNDQGKFVKEVPAGLAGMYAKDPKTEEKIISYLKKNNAFFQEEAYTHDYPFCWRCSSALIYYARSSWFIRMSTLRKKLLSENKKIHWVPGHLQKGRFGEWLREVKDWAVSRERYWGTPLPIWECNTCGEIEVLGSTEDLKKKIRKDHNTYILVRHGEAESNKKNILSSYPEKKAYHLTPLGKKQVESLCKKLKKEGDIDLIYSSDITRAKETAGILKEKLGFSSVLYDKRLREISFGRCEGKPYSCYEELSSVYEEKNSEKIAGIETLEEVRSRIFEFVNSIEKKHSGKTVVVVSHGYPLWALQSVLSGWDRKQARKERDTNFVETGSYRKTQFVDVPRDETGNFDLHRPYIDQVIFPCSCGGEMKRVPEVADVWFDSGAMPFAQAHWPFGTKKFNTPPSAYPADYITEGIDQTRGWFYTLLAIGTLLGFGTPYRHVISLGLVLDKKGQKMSKSKGNGVNPWEIMEKYGIDVARWYLYTINPPGEPKKFDEADLVKVSRQVFLLLFNSFKFLSLYGHKSALTSTINPPQDHILDAWIFSRLNLVKGNVTKKLDEYEVGEAAREIEELVLDISRWYIRRSRRRFQPNRHEGGSISDHKNATIVLASVLKEISKLMAPFTPFISEALYTSLTNKKNDSVHLASWGRIPQFSKKDQSLCEKMEEIRKIASAGLSERERSGIKVRQPLNTLTIRTSVLSPKTDKDLLEILREEVNVKIVKLDPKAKKDVDLDTALTEELKIEGMLREFVRAVQGLRQDASLNPQDLISVSVSGDDGIVNLLKTNEKSLCREVNAEKFVLRDIKKEKAVREIKIGGREIRIEIKKK